jgi:plasmid stability protein
MTETLTIRLPAEQRRALRARAAATGKSESQVVRDLLETQLSGTETVGERAGRFFGKVEIDPADADRDPWRLHLRRANTRP